MKKATILATILLNSCVFNSGQEIQSAMTEAKPKRLTAPQRCRHLYNQEGQHMAWAACMGVAYIIEEN